MSSPAESTSPTFLAWALSLALAAAVLVAGAVGVDQAAGHVLGSHARATRAGTDTITPGGRVLLGNSVAQSAITTASLESVLGGTVVDLTDRGSGPTTWYVQLAHHLARAQQPPKEVIIAAPPGWFAKLAPIQDAAIALELSTWDDPVLAGLLGVSEDALAVQRHVAGRTRVRDAWIQLLGRPWGRRLARSAPASEDPLTDALDGAVERTLRQTGSANTRRGATAGPSAELEFSQMYLEADPGLIALAGVAERAGIRLILVVLPERRDGKVLFASSIIIGALPQSTRFVDLSGLLLRSVDYVDSVHFSMEARAFLSPAVARAVRDVSLGKVRVRAYTELPSSRGSRPSRRR